MITWQGAAPQFVAAGRRGGGGRGDDGRGDGGRGGRGDAGRGGQQVSLQMTLAEYKTVNGLRLPHRITRGTNDMTTEEWTIDSYRINQTFRADVFTK
jgi:ribosomal protein L15